MERKRIVAAYCRVSTLEQKKKGYGVDIQIREINRYAEANSLNIGRFYIDEAQSGVSEERKALRRLVKDCRAGKIEAIIVSSLDRLSRDLRFTENLFFEIQGLNIKILIADMPHYDHKNRKDVLIRQIKSAIAEENRKEIIDRLKKGREERVRKGKMAGGTLPYGYKRIGRDVEKDPAEAGIIASVFEQNYLGKSGREIADYLNSKGFLRRNGQPWTQRQVWAILNRKDLYQKGIVKYGEIRGENQDLVILGRD
jgi:site-specific DNA recombinase